MYEYLVCGTAYYVDDRLLCARLLCGDAYYVRALTMCTHLVCGTAYYVLDHILGARVTWIT